MSRTVRTICFFRPCTHQGKQRFCKSHEMPLCMKCALESHGLCEDIVSINDASVDDKWIADLEETVERAIRKNKICVQDLESLSVESEKDAVRRMILEKRAEIDKHLDYLQNNLLEKDLEHEDKQCQEKDAVTLKKLGNLNKDLEEIRNALCQIKKQQPSTENRVELLQIGQKVKDRLNDQYSITRNRQLLDRKIEVTLNPDIQTFQTKVSTFGNIEIRERALECSDEEQFLETCNNGSFSDITSMGLKLTAKFSVLQESTKAAISGCTMTANGRLFIADYYGSGNLTEYTETGKFVGNIDISPKKPFDVATVDDNTIAVSNGSRDVEIINISTRKVIKVVQGNGNVWRLSDLQGKLCFIDDGIVIKDFSGTGSKRFKIEFIRHATVEKKVIYYIDSRVHAVHCCDMSGEHILTYLDDSIDSPTFVVTDTAQNVFVVGQASNNVTAIRRDGKIFKTLLTAQDGIFNPGAMCFNKDKAILCLGLNDKGEVAVYTVE